MGRGIDWRGKLQVFILCSKLNRLHNDKIMPINLRHLLLLLFHLLLSTHAGGFLLLVPSKSCHGLVNYLLRVASAFLKLFHLVLVGHEALRVSVHQGCEVAEESVSRLQEVELRISTFTLRQADQEFLAIASDELRCQLDDVRVHRCNVGMVHHILVRWWWLDLFLPLLSHRQCFKLFLLQPLGILFCLLVYDCLRNFGLCILNNTSFELFDFVFVVRPVGIVGQQEGELRMVLLAKHSLLKPFTTFGHELRGLVDHTTNIWRREDEPNSRVAFVVIRHTAATQEYP
mmetsp:Transcript_34656/g.83174  ORF Transcript_34656/g.83174 Transcript_34656/m.83174 type:complete len:287 (+) Transcript_34656:1342-2202(+)